VSSIIESFNDFNESTAHSRLSVAARVDHLPGFREGDPGSPAQERLNSVHAARGVIQNRSNLQNLWSLGKDL
jgi:hypothetical protein